MLERLQYALILLLFVLAGSLDGPSFQDGVGGVQPSLNETVAARPPQAARNYFSAALCSCSASIEAPVVPSDHKALFRQRTDVRTAVDAAFGVRTAMRAYSPALHRDPVDYYVFSLGRILI